MPKSKRGVKQRLRQKLRLTSARIEERTRLPKPEMAGKDEIRPVYPSTFRSNVKVIKQLSPAVPVCTLLKAAEIDEKYVCVKNPSIDDGGEKTLSAAELLAAEVEAVKTSTVACPVSAQVRAAMGMGARSRGTAKGQSDCVFNAIGDPKDFPPLHIDNKPYNFVQELNLQVFNASSASAVTTAQFTFTLSSLDQVASYQTLFDQYRVAKIWVKTMPRVAASYSAASNSALYATVIDYDDSTALGSLEAAEDYQNVITSNGWDSHFREFVPHCAVAAYSGTFVSYMNVASPWIDCASPGVIHYGMKLVQGFTDVVYTMDLVYRVHLQFRNVR